MGETNARLCGSYASEYNAVVFGENMEINGNHIIAMGNDGKCDRDGVICMSSKDLMVPLNRKNLGGKMVSIDRKFDGVRSNAHRVSALER